MEFIIYPKLSTRSKRAIQKKLNKRWYGGKDLTPYVPRANLLERLSQELNLSTSEVLIQLDLEVSYLQRMGIVI